MTSWTRRLLRGALLIFFSLLIFMSTAGGCRQINTAPTSPATKPETQTSEKPASEEEISYFAEIALGAEYGENGQVIHKWPRDLRIQVKGSPTEQDNATLNKVIEEINGLIEGVQLKRASWNDNVRIYFIPESRFSYYDSNYVPTNYGFFWDWWSDNQEIYRARILISTDKITQIERSHLIREELTQALGLMKDSLKYQDSVFYQNWSAATEYAPIDRSLIKMLYRSDIKAGMSGKEALDALRSLRP